MPASPVRRRRHPCITRDGLIESALTIIDEAGLDALTMRHLAAKVDVTPMALYAHYESRDALLAAIGDRLVAALDVPLTADHLEWDSKIVLVLRCVGTAAAKHPAAASLFSSRLPHSTAGRLAREVVLGSFCTAGFNVDAARLITDRAVRWSIDHHCLMTHDPEETDTGILLLESFFLAGARALAQTRPADLSSYRVVPTA